MSARGIGIALLVVTSVLAASGPCEAQLLSPGRLAEPHSELEGLRQCTSCHELGKRGVATERCLDCHAPLAERIVVGVGYHASVPPDACADCHPDHLGADADLVRLDPATFDHADTGYDLQLSHASLECRTCHEPSHISDPDVVAVKGERDALGATFLGLPADCGSCHRTDSPHGDGFGARGCVDCHDAGAWASPLPFDHRGTGFPLEGRHADVTCAQCHGSDTTPNGGGARILSACDGCHASPHGGAMRGDCVDCHDTRGWHALSAAAVDGAFDHSRTSFALRGAHSVADCAACHRPGRPPRSELLHITYRPGTAANTYPRPVADRCASCHVDRHADLGDAGRWLRCADCHSEAEWAPSAFDVSRHSVESRFPLTGAHTATPCSACHVRAEEGHERFGLALASTDCAACHETDDRHRAAYEGIECEACHTTSAFEVVEYAHAWAPGVIPECEGCHAADDPHAGQFAGRACSSCHETDDFAVEGFDHAQARFPLDGAHRSADCAGCHRAEGPPGERFVRYRPLGTECTDCHGDDR